MAVTGDGELLTAMAMLAAMASSHMSMPNFWLPYAIIGRAQGWKLQRTLFVVSIGIFGHVLTTMVITLALSSLGGTLLSDSAYRFFSSGLLLALGIYYLYTYLIRGDRYSCCEKEHSMSLHAESKSGILDEADDNLRQPMLPQTSESSERRRKAEDNATIVSLVSLTALSPCIGSMPVLLALATPPISWAWVAAAAGVLTVTSMIVVGGLVAATYLGAARLDFARVRKHERLILGIGLVLLAGLTYFILSQHHNHGQFARQGTHAHGGGAVNNVQGTTQMKGMEQNDLLNKSENPDDTSNNVVSSGTHRHHKHHHDGHHHHGHGHRHHGRHHGHGEDGNRGISGNMSSTPKSPDGIEIDKANHEDDGRRDGDDHHHKDHDDDEHHHESHHKDHGKHPETLRDGRKQRLRDDHDPPERARHDEASALPVKREHRNDSHRHRHHKHEYKDSHLANGGSW